MPTVLLSPVHPMLSIKDVVFRTTETITHIILPRTVISVTNVPAPAYNPGISRNKTTQDYALVDQRHLVEICAARVEDPIRLFGCPAFKCELKVLLDQNGKRQAIMNSKKDPGIPVEAHNDSQFDNGRHI
ncbi:hypothetical protein LA080_012973 [Diaporthe eres]|nr:hypothetical protein LA080_012973 [Diaporthe eres]